MKNKFEEKHVKMQWDKVTLDEQETILSYDYYAKTFNLYTSRCVTYRKLLNQIGQPDEVYMNYNKIYAASWKIPFSDRKRIRQAGKLNIVLMFKQKEIDV